MDISKEVMMINLKQQIQQSETPALVNAKGEIKIKTATFENRKNGNLNQLKTHL